jgi:hypothetical protein
VTNQNRLSEVELDVRQKLDVSAVQHEKQLSDLKRLFEQDKMEVKTQVVVDADCLC